MIGQTLREAVVHHQAGRFDEAEDLYRAVLEVAPNNADACNLLGLIAHEQGRYEEAIKQIGLALQANDQVSAYHNNMGAAQRSAGLFQRAEASFARAAELSPTNDSAWSNLVGILDEQGRVSRVKSVLDAWVRCSPDSRQARESRASERMAFGDLVGAMEDQMAVATLVPDDPVPCLQVAIVSHQHGDDATALKYFSEARVRHMRRTVLTTATVQTKLTHDLEQVQWLKGQGNTDHDWERIGAAYRRAYERLYGASGVELAPKNLGPEILAEVGEWYNRPFHIEPCPALPENAVSGACDIRSAEAKYLESVPGITTLDGFLTAEAIEQLRRFCLNSTIWGEFRYNGGYVGSTVGQGFANGLLLQIARELRARMPTVLGAHPLRQMWAFKYDQRRTGIGVHADQAAVNVNFWITPDEANRDPDRGGLVVWRKRAPLEWDFDDFNRKPEKLVAWVNQTGAEKFSVPYRCNRAVLFDSDLVHRTDDFEFAPGYENRRINITMLFGSRRS